MRRAARRDTNEPAIRALLDSLAVPYRMVSCPALGDLEIIHRGRAYVVEIKDGNKPYTRAQRERREWLQAHGVTMDDHPTWRTLDEAIAWLR